MEESTHAQAKVDCVILAAGLSSRTGKNKMLLNIGGKSIIERCIGAFYDSCSKIIVVTGKYHQEIKQCLRSYSNVYFAYNEDYQKGMFSSIKTGVRYVENKRFFVTPGDYPLLSEDTVKSMLESTEKYIVPVYKEKQGHPVLLDEMFIPIISNSKCASLRDCLNNFSSEKMRLDVNDKGIVTDIDTIQDYKKLNYTKEIQAI